MRIQAMREFALVLLCASLPVVALAALGINRSRHPDWTYLAVILGVGGIFGLIASLALFAAN
jgi:hypothetical protein